MNVIVFWTGYHTKPFFFCTERIFTPPGIQILHSRLLALLLLTLAIYANRSGQGVSTQVRHLLVGQSESISFSFHLKCCQHLTPPWHPHLRLPPRPGDVFMSFFMALSTRHWVSRGAHSSASTSVEAEWTWSVFASGWVEWKCCPSRRAFELKMKTFRMVARWNSEIAIGTLRYPSACMFKFVYDNGKPFKKNHYCINALLSLDVITNHKNIYLSLKRYLRSSYYHKVLLRSEIYPRYRVSKDPEC